MADGTSKPISQIEPGDQVLATDPETGEQSARTVTAVWVHEDDLVDLQLAIPGELGTDERMVTVTTTEDHPFWNESGGEWQRADSLGPGDELLAADGAAPAVVGLLDYTERRALAYDLTVSGVHTYSVLAADDTPVLVHNCPSGGINFKIEPKIRKQMGSRGWTDADISQTINNPSRTEVTRDTRWNPNGTQRNDPATGYVNPDGSYVIRNDVDGTIVQVSNRNDPNWKAPW